MSRLVAASNPLIVRKLSAVLTRVFCAASFLCGSACGDSSDDDTAQAQDAGKPASTITQPAASLPDSAGAGASEPPPPPPLACGPSACARPKNVAADLLRSVTGLPMTGADTVACCLDAEEGICSSAASFGATCDAVAVSDNRCPGVDLSALSDLVGGLVDSTRDAMIGCCTHGACGLDGKIFGRGCVENAEAKRMLSVVPVIGPLINVPPPRACDLGGVTSEPSETDAGT